MEPASCVIMQKKEYRKTKERGELNPSPLCYRENLLTVSTC